jgi:replication-associated recombination protein RarA
MNNIICDMENQKTIKNNKRHIDDETIEPKNKKRSIIDGQPPRIKIEESLPPINCLRDLINLTNPIKLYKQIDVFAIIRIVQYLEELDKMIGMKSLKESILYQILYYLQGMHKKNVEGEYLHTIILGPPGYGKTTVSTILGNIYKELNIFKKQKSKISSSSSSSSTYDDESILKIAHRDDFIAEYLGQTAIKTKKLLTSCLGGVIFIDEIYSLGSIGNKDIFSKEAIDTLTGFLSEHKNDFCCIIAGYEEDVKECFFSVNKGLIRRFPWVHRIEKYSDSELADIFLKMLKDINWETTITHNMLKESIKKDKDLFENAGGDLENFLTKCKIIHSKRILTSNIKDKFILSIHDITNTIKLLKENKLNEKDDHNYDHIMYI